MSERDGAYQHVKHPPTTHPTCDSPFLSAPNGTLSLPLLVSPCGHFFLFSRWLVFRTSRFQLSLGKRAGGRPSFRVQGLGLGLRCQGLGFTPVGGSVFRMCVVKGLALRSGFRSAPTCHMVWAANESRHIAGW
eukprot:2837737-Rhodomonas_salina.1